MPKNDCPRLHSSIRSKIQKDAMTGRFLYSQAFDLGPLQVGLRAFGTGLWLLVLFAAVAAGPAAIAQDADTPPSSGSEPPPSGGSEPPPSGIEEIVVRGAESDSAEDFATADSVTGFGAEDLAALGAQNLADLASFTPNLEIVTSGATSPTFFIRGVGLNDFNSNSTGAVAIYQDDVARNAPALQLPLLFDVETVNVLRGPQGTGLARNASAGAIKIYSRKPSGDYGGYFYSEIGDYDYRDYEGAVEAPMWEDILAARFAFRVSERDGTMKNRCGNAIPFADRAQVPSFNQQVALGVKNTDPPWSICGEPVERLPQTQNRSTIPEGLKPKVNNRDIWALRGTFLLQPTLDMTWLVSGHGSRRDETTRLGQSIGVNGFYCLNDDITNCGYRPPIPGDDGSSRVNGVLGGQQGIATTGYQPQEIRARLIELAPCNASVPGSPAGTCNSNPDRDLKRADDNQAKIQLANELARNLDSKPYVGDFNLTGPTHNDTYGGYLKGEIALPWGGMQLTTVTGGDGYDRDIAWDLDFSPETLFHIFTDDDGWQVTQDVRLEGSYGEQADIRWDVGGWFMREQLNVNVVNDLGPFSAFGVGERDYTQDLWSAAGYASLSFDFWEDFTLFGGVRYNWEQKKLDYSLARGGSPDFIFQKLNDEWTAPTGTIRLTYRFREDTHVFWKYTRGWKPGTYNATSSISAGVSTAKPETLDSFETGLKGSWFEGRLNLDFSLFYYKYENYQLFTAQQFAGGQPEFVILNANKAEVYGAEVDVSGRPWDGAFVNVRFGWLESQFVDFVQLQQDITTIAGRQTVVNRELNNTGNRLLNSPQFKVSITAEQSFPLGRFGNLTPRYDGVWTDTTYYDATEGRGIPNNANQQFLPKNTTAQKPFWIHNLRVAWTPPGATQIEIAAWVRNLTDEAYKNFAFDGSTFNSTTIYFVGDPRTYGGSLRVSF